MKYVVDEDDEKEEEEEENVMRRSRWQGSNSESDYE